MDFTPPRQLITKWRDEYAEVLEERKQQALADFDRKWFADSVEQAETSQTLSAAGEKLAANRKDNASTNGLTRTITIKQMVSKTVSEIHDDTFTSADVRERLLERWPQDESNSRNLSSRISQVLKAMETKGDLERVSKGPRVQDPVFYRKKAVHEKNEGSLLSP